MASASLMKTNVYVDGFNLFYGCVKDTPFRWLNLAQLCQYSFRRIVFTAFAISLLPSNPGQATLNSGYISIFICGHSVRSQISPSTTGNFDLVWSGSRWHSRPPGVHVQSKS